MSVETNMSYSGMLEMVERGETDIMLADLSYSRDREERIDFTAPFMNIGVGTNAGVTNLNDFLNRFLTFTGMLYKNENNRQLNLFSFLEPFTMEIWLLMLLSYVTVSAVFYWISKNQEM